MGSATMTTGYFSSLLSRIPFTGEGCILPIYVFSSIPTDVDVIWERPLLFWQETLTFSCTGLEPALEKIIHFLKHLGMVPSIAYEAAGYRGYQVLPRLLEKERLVLTAAIGSRYYEYPRRISATELADTLRYSKSTLIEYLKKAENKVTGELSGRLT